MPSSYNNLIPVGAGRLFRGSKFSHAFCQTKNPWASSTALWIEHELFLNGSRMFR